MTTDITKLAANVEIDLLLRRLSNLEQCNLDYDFAEWQELARDACAKLEELRQ